MFYTAMMILWDFDANFFQRTLESTTFHHWKASKVVKWKGMKMEGLALISERVVFASLQQWVSMKYAACLNYKRVDLFREKETLSQRWQKGFLVFPRVCFGIDSRSETNPRMHFNRRKCCELKLEVPSDCSRPSEDYVWDKPCPRTST